LQPVDFVQVSSTIECNEQMSVSADIVDLDGYVKTCNRSEKIPRYTINKGKNKTKK